MNSLITSIAVFVALVIGAWSHDSDLTRQCFDRGYMKAWTSGEKIYCQKEPPTNKEIDN